MANSIVRTDKWLLEPTPGQLEHLRLTQKFYRLFVRALIGVVYTHYRDIVDADSPCAAVEKLIHKTKSNPKPRYTYFDARFYKFPSYLRRAAIEAAIGQGSSFVTRYYIWQSGIRNRRDARPPRLNADTNICAVLYKGQCIKFSDDLTRAEIKVFNGSDWVWSDITIKTKRERHLIDGNKQLLPSLVLDRSRAYLALPFQVPCRKQKHTEKKFEEIGAKVELVYPRGTSSWAFDGSGQVKRSKTNYTDAQFSTGKRYNADLNGSYNIGARYWAYKLKLAYRNGSQLPGGKSSTSKQRVPVTLSTLWECEAAHVRAAYMSGVFTQRQRLFKKHSLATKSRLSFGTTTSDALLASVASSRLSIFRRRRNNPDIDSTKGCRTARLAL